MEAFARALLILAMNCLLFLSVGSGTFLGLHMHYGGDQALSVKDCSAIGSIRDYD